MRIFLALLLSANILLAQADYSTLLLLETPAVSSTPDPATSSGIVQFNYGDGDASGTGVDQTWTATVGPNLTTDSTTGRPTKSTTSINGKSFATYNFDGTLNYMTNGGTWTATQPRTRFITFRLTDNALPTSRFFCAGNESGRADLRSDNVPTYSFYAGDAGGFQNFASPLPNTNWNIAIIIEDGANSRLQINGGNWSVIGATPGSDTITGLCVGALYFGGGVVNPAAVNVECVGLISNTNYATWGASLTNWMHGRLY